MVWLLVFIWVFGWFSSGFTGEFDIVTGFISGFLCLVLWELSFCGLFQQKCTKFAKPRHLAGVLERLPHLKDVQDVQEKPSLFTSTEGKTTQNSNNALGDRLPSKRLPSTTISPFFRRVFDCSSLAPGRRKLL